MKIHTFCFGIFLLSLTACGAGANTAEKGQLVPSVYDQASSSAMTSSVTSSAASMQRVEPSLKADLVSSEQASVPSTEEAVESFSPSVSHLIHITVAHGIFTPSKIVVKRGDNVKLRITSKESDFGFSIPDLNVNEHVRQGTPLTIRLNTSATGKFEFSCSILCGSGFNPGTITVAK